MLDSVYFCPAGNPVILILAEDARNILCRFFRIKEFLQNRLRNQVVLHQRILILANQFTDGGGDRVGAVLDHLFQIDGVRRSAVWSEVTADFPLLEEGTVASWVLRKVLKQDIEVLLSECFHLLGCLEW